MHLDAYIIQKGNHPGSMVVAFGPQDLIFSVACVIASGSVQLTYLNMIKTSDGLRGTWSSSVPLS